MPARRLTEQQAALSDAWKQNPQRARKNPKASGEIGNAPTYLEKDERSVWREVVAAAPSGVLKAADRILLEQVCILTAKMRRREDMKTSERALLMNCLGRLGLTPMDRTKFEIKDEEPSGPDPISEFLN